MPSPPPLGPISSPSDVRGGAPIDLAHLARMTLDDAGLKREVLGMFLKQAGELLAALAACPGAGAAPAHTLKGSARAIGAFHVAACAEALEGAIREGRDPLPALAELDAATVAASAAIEDILAEPRASIGRSDPL